MLDVRLPLVKLEKYCDPDEIELQLRNGWLAHNWQVLNGGVPADCKRNMAEAREVGANAGVWVVCYLQSRFEEDGRRAAELALAHEAKHLTVDVEFALKATRGTGLIERTLIKGIRDGGWKGAIHLNTLAGPSNAKTAQNPTGNDYGFDYQAFVKTSTADEKAGVFIQCYFNCADEYRPEPSIEHVKLFVPEEQINVTFSLRHSEAYMPKPGILMRGSEWVRYLDEADVWRNLSAFTGTDMWPEDIAALAKYTKRAGYRPTLPRPPLPGPRPLTEYRDAALAILDEAVRVHGLAVGQTTRVRHMLRVGRTTDEKRKLVDPALDRIGV